jgi:hypothetical protein
MSRFPQIATSTPLASSFTACAIAAVMLLSTMSSAWAADTQPAASPAHQQTASPASSNREAPTGTHIVSKPTDLEKIVVFEGAVHGAGDAQWTDNDTSVGELPMSRE